MSATKLRRQDVTDYRSLHWLQQSEIIRLKLVKSADLPDALQNLNHQRRTFCFWKPGNTICTLLLANQIEIDLFQTRKSWFSKANVRQHRCSVSKWTLFHVERLLNPLVPPSLQPGTSSCHMDSLSGNFLGTGTLLDYRLVVDCIQGYIRSFIKAYTCFLRKTSILQF